MTKINLNTFTSRLKYPYRIIRNRILGTCEPIIVAIAVNNACNLKCRYCYGDYCGRKDRKDFTTEEIKKLVDDLHALGTRVLTIHGGETFLRDDVKEIVDYMKKKGMYVNFITNGILLKKKVEEIRNVDSLCISLDGREEGNDLNRGKNTFKVILESIKFAKKEGFKLRVQSTITKNTINDIEYLAELAKEIGYSQEFSILYPSGGAVEHFEELIPSDEETKNAILKIIDLKKRGYPIYTAFEVLEHTLHWPFPYSRPHLSENEIPKDFKYIRCYYGLNKFTIDADGFIYPCFARMDNFKALNFKEVGVKKAIQHVIDNNKCIACIHFTNNDHNLLLGLSPKQIFNQCILQLKEIFGKY